MRQRIDRMSHKRETSGRKRHDGKEVGFGQGAHDTFHPMFDMLSIIDTVKGGTNGGRGGGITKTVLPKTVVKVKTVLPKTVLPKTGREGGTEGGRQGGREGGREEGKRNRVCLTRITHL
jgi:hypothetical protein